MGSTVARLVANVLVVMSCTTQLSCDKLVAKVAREVVEEGAELGGKGVRKGAAKRAGRRVLQEGADGNVLAKGFLSGESARRLGRELTEELRDELIDALEEQAIREIFAPGLDGEWLTKALVDLGSGVEFVEHTRIRRRHLGGGVYWCHQISDQTFWVPLGPEPMRLIYIRLSVSYIEIYSENRVLTFTVDAPVVRDHGLTELLSESSELGATFFSAEDGDTTKEMLTAVRDEIQAFSSKPVGDFWVADIEARSAEVLRYRHEGQTFVETRDSVQPTYGALYWSDQGQWGTVSGASSIDNAKERAQLKCSKGDDACRLATSFSNNCIMVYASDGQRKFIIGKTMIDLFKEFRVACPDGPGTCSIDTMACNTGY